MVMLQPDVPGEIQMIAINGCEADIDRFLVTFVQFTMSTQLKVGRA